MDTSLEQISELVRGFLATEVGQAQGPSFFDDARPLLTSGLLDSVTIMRLITFLEAEYPIEFMAYELDVNYLDTVGLIARTVHEKLEGAG